MLEESIVNFHYSYFSRKQAAALGVKGQQKETPASRSKSTQIRKRGQHRVEKGKASFECLSVSL